MAYAADSGRLARRGAACDSSTDGASASMRGVMERHKNGGVEDGGGDVEARS